MKVLLTTCDRCGVETKESRMLMDEIHGYWKYGQHVEYKTASGWSVDLCPPCLAAVLAEATKAKASSETP